MRDREPFVSGLPGPVTHAGPPLPDRAGLELLRLIEAIARDDAEALEPLCTMRFDGVERTPPDPVAIEKRRGYLGMVRLVQWIEADAGRLAAAAAALAKVSGEFRAGR